MAKTLDLTQLKNNVLKVTLSVFVPNTESPEQGKEICGEMFLELTPQMSNTEIMKKTKALLLDLKQAVASYKPAPRPMNGTVINPHALTAANHNPAPLVGFEPKAIVEPDAEGIDVPVFTPPPVEHNEKE